ncbi:MAG: insulinase family protein, partial [Chitinophagales bacterium]
MNQDRDARKVWKAFMLALFSTYTYGTQTTIGEGEHLKNPSMYNITNYFTQYYVPNNMAICIAGDIAYDQTIALVDKYFGGYKSRPLPEWKVTKEAPIKEVQRREVFGLEAENLMMGYRLPGSSNKDIITARLVASLLYNGQAGLIDLDLNQQQKVQSAWSNLYELKDYGVLYLGATPREGQTLEQCEALLLDQIKKIQTGNFDDFLIKACINDMRLARTKSFETNQGRANAFVSSFILGKPWDVYLKEYDQMEKLTKQDIMQFANTYLQDNSYVIVYKRQGPDNSVQKVEKPGITPVEANRENESAFLKQFMQIPSASTKPEFVDFASKIQQSNLASGVEFNYIKNELNDIFELYYILNMGSDNDKVLSLAVEYLPLLGTEKYSAAELQQEFFKYGLSF